MPALLHNHSGLAAAIAAFLLVSTNTSPAAQGHQVHLELDSAVDTSNAAISQVLRLWESYLSSNPDSTSPSPYWSESEQQRYKPFDLAPHTWWNPSLYAWLPRCRTQVLSVSRAGEAYVIRTMLYNSFREDSGRIGVITIIRTGARLENGTYKLCNVLPINTRSWQREQVGSIRFVFPADHQFDRALAGRMGRFVDSLAGLWHLRQIPTEYYFADDLDRVFKAVGFDFWMLEGKTTPGGFTDVHNHIIYAGGSNEWYPHEFVHMYVNPLFPHAHSYFLEGYATLVGGSGGHDLTWHLRRNYEYLKNHPDVDLLTFKGVDPHVMADYFIGGLLCRMAEEKGGIALIRKLMTYGKEESDLYRAIQDTFGVDKPHVNEFLRKSLAAYAAH